MACSPRFRLFDPNAHWDLVKSFIARPQKSMDEIEQQIEEKIQLRKDIELAFANAELWWTVDEAIELNEQLLTREVAGVCCRINKSSVGRRLESDFNWMRPLWIAYMCYSRITQRIWFFVLEAKSGTQVERNIDHTYTCVADQFWGHQPTLDEVRAFVLPKRKLLTNPDTYLVGVVNTENEGWHLGIFVKDDEAGVLAVNRRPKPSNKAKRVPSIMAELATAA